MGNVTARDWAGNEIQIKTAAIKKTIKARDFMVQFSFFLDVMQKPPGGMNYPPEASVSPSC
jgi:hypothetical protein